MIIFYRHTFHSDCIRKWIEKNPICPLCKIGLRSTDEERPIINTNLRTNSANINTRSNLQQSNDNQQNSNTFNNNSYNPPQIIDRNNINNN
jgi:hypothetical protein